MTNILDDIIKLKRKEVARKKETRPLATLKALASTSQEKRSLIASIKQQHSQKKPHIIAECKKKSPSKGLLCDPYDPVDIACSYQRGGASAISVLTDFPFFGGDIEHLRSVQNAVSVPVLRKDFIVDEYQIWESKAYGADAILLIAGVLDPVSIQYFTEISRDLEMDSLVESHSVEDLSGALQTDAILLGLNNRNLISFDVDVEGTATRFYQQIENNKDRLFVCESGIKTKDDIERMSKYGYSSFLIGETLVKHHDKEQAVRNLIT